MSITRKQSGIFAETMIRRGSDVFQLHKNGDFGLVNNNGEFKAIYRYDPSKVEGSGEVVWEQSVDNLVSHNQKLKYKTHLSNYLYQTLQPIIKNILSSGLTGNKKIDAILKSDKYRKYLQNREIEIERFTFNDEELKVSAGSTGFVNHRKIPFYTQEELLALHEEVRQLAVNEPKAKVHKPYKKKKLIEDKYNEYVVAYDKYDRDFKRLGVLWKWKIMHDGIRQGYGEDEIYTEIMRPIDSRLQATRHRDNIVNQIHTIAYELEQKKNDLENLDPRVTEIHVYL